MYDRLTKQYIALVKGHHPEMPKSDLEVLVKKLVSVTEDFVTALKETDKRPAVDITNLPSYRKFRQELATMPSWFEEYIKHRRV